MIRVFFCSLMLIFLVSCKSLPLPDSGVLKSLGDALPGPSPTNPLNAAKSLPNLASIPKPGLPSPSAVIPVPRMPVVPTPGRVAAMARAGYYAPVRPPHRSMVVPTAGLRPIHVTRPYSMSVHQREFTRLGVRGLDEVNAADPARRALVMESVLERLINTPYILSQPLSVRQSLTTGSLDQRWIRVYSIYGYPVSVPYYYHPERKTVKTTQSDARGETIEIRTGKQDAEAVALYLAQLQMFLLSMVENTGVIHAKNGKLIFRDTILPKTDAGIYQLELVDGHGTIGITSQAVRTLKDNKLAIIGKSGLNNIVMEPTLLKDLNVVVSGNDLKFGKSTIAVSDVENLFIGGEQISLANLQEADQKIVAEQIKTAIAKAPAQAVFSQKVE